MNKIIRRTILIIKNSKNCDATAVAVSAMLTIRLDEICLFIDFTISVAAKFQ